MGGILDLSKKIARSNREKIVKRSKLPEGYSCAAAVLQNARNVVPSSKISSMPVLERWMIH